MRQLGSAAAGVCLSFGVVCYLSFIMLQSLFITITLITLCGNLLFPIYLQRLTEGVASALKFPMMGGNIIYPHRPQSDDTTASGNEKRSYQELERRREMWERRTEARAQLEERGLFNWFDGLFDSSANCYVKGYPSYGGSCASTSSPYIRSPVPFLILPFPHCLCCQMLIVVRWCNVC